MDNSDKYNKLIDDFTGIGHQLDQPARKANKAKSDMEELLHRHMLDGIIKTGDKLYNLMSEMIEELNNIAYHEKEEYERRD